MDPRRTRPRARAATVPLPRDAARPLALDRLVPSTRSIVVGIGLLLSGVAAIAVARHTSVFAIRTIDVQGAPPVLERRVRAALTPLLGESLSTLNGATIEARLARLRDVQALSYDRAFPNTLRIVVRPHPPVALVQSGSRAWFASGHGAVLRRLKKPPTRPWPRVWLARTEAPVGARAALPTRVGSALRALAAARASGSPLWRQVRTARGDAGGLTFVLRSGLELRLGSERDVPLKLAVAGRLLATLRREEHAVFRYLDLSVPARPVAGRWG